MAEIFTMKVELQDSMSRRGGNLALCCLNENIRRIFDLIGAAKILSIYDTEKDALESI